jgi:Transmembrane domain of unknown function (DUF3566)
VIKRRRRGTRIRQKLRRVELWPVLKLAIAFHTICAAITLGVLVLLWRLGEQAGFTDKVTSFLTKIGFADSVTLNGKTIFNGAATVVGALTIHNIVVTFLLAVLYNLLSGLFGGLILSVVEERQKPTADESKTRVRRVERKQTQAPKVIKPEILTVVAPGSREVPGAIPGAIDESIDESEDEGWMDDLDGIDLTADVTIPRSAPQSEAKPDRKADLKS